MNKLKLWLMIAGAAAKGQELINKGVKKA